MPTDDQFNDAIADALGFQSAEESTTARKKTNWSPMELIKAQRELAKINKPAATRKFRVKPE
jgi:hypothetical protein